MQDLRAVRQLALRPPLPGLRHPIVYPALAAPVSVDLNPCLRVYRTKIDLGLFSCDWENYAAGPVTSYWHDLTELDFYVRRLFRIHGPIRLLAFLDFYELCILFEASGEYCYLDTGGNDCQCLVHYGHAFESPDEFLTAFIHGDPPLEETEYKFPEDTEDLYASGCEELTQRREAEKAGQK
ncbi:hypothetical protein K438DRAFT_1995990 [Mycena galopus ATCC 62051]|nr:hypothetical protein K438DRAFT_1995990 [Mycena galopus ATCC 62051]